MPVFHLNPYTKIEKIKYQFPKAFRPEYLPEPTVADYSFGFFQNDVSVVNDTFIYKRECVISKRKIGSDDYPDYYNFRKLVEKTDNCSWVFIQK